ncbi:5'/3'-nucleotidase SurE [Halocatena halophila]|uniref:5'/3'-nucleotidase SurE n=1 Tax=Halocatena halophila TaxID=2814576 RepID=UPI002ED0D6D9
MEILLTNDDGIDAPGLKAVYDALAPIASVTAIAPATDQSAVGRTLSHRVAVEEHDLGYAVSGTPTDCVVVGIQALDTSFDLVVSGCNRGGNLGAYVLGRSGTVSAAVEATFFELPAIALSMHIPAAEYDYETFEPTVEQYADPARVIRYLTEETRERPVFETTDYLNVNVPLVEGPIGSLQLTEPSTTYEMDAIREDAHVVLRDRIFERIAEGTLPEPPGTDRRVVLDGNVSVSPLTAPHSTSDTDALEAIVSAF